MARKSPLRQEPQPANLSLMQIKAAIPKLGRRLAELQAFNPEAAAHRRLVMNLTFAKKLRYNRGSGFGTTDYSLPFTVIGDLDHNKYEMVGPGRVELPTSRLSGVRSNHLSYEPLSPDRARKRV
jgi:hypothetical protein